MAIADHLTAEEIQKAFLITTRDAVRMIEVDQVLVDYLKQTRGLDLTQHPETLQWYVVRDGFFLFDHVSYVTVLEWALAQPSSEKREPLADASHDIWSSWMRWMFTVGAMNADGTWTMPAELVARWQRQMNTPYADLTEGEKDLDREQADKILAVLK